MDDDAQIISVIGGAKRRGRWRVPGSTRTLTLFGRCLIDMRQAETSAEEICFSCISVFAAVTFMVPEGAEVRPSGVAVLGSARSDVPVTDTPAHLPPISIDAITVLGRLRIRTTHEEPDKGRRLSRRERRRAADANGRAEPGPAAPAVHEDASAPRAGGRHLAGADATGGGRSPSVPNPWAGTASPSAPTATATTNGTNGTAASASAPTSTLDAEPTGSLDDFPTAFDGDAEPGPWD